MAFSPEQLNFFKFSTVVLDEFPVILREVFVFMWDTLIASRSGVPKWDDTVTVLNMFLLKEGGATKVPTLNKSYKDWDCTALFKATLFAQTFAMPDTLDKLYVRPSGLSAGTFHLSVVSPTGNQAETYALALDQLRLLRNTLCHQISTRNIDKKTFDRYILLAKDAFNALGQDTTKIDDIGKLSEEDFPTARLQQVEDELKREKDAAIKFKQIDDHLINIESQVDDVGSAVKDVKNDVTDVKTRVGDVGSAVKDVKSDVTDVKTRVGDVGSDMKDVKNDVTDVKTRVGDVGSDMKDVKNDVTDVKTRVGDVGSAVKDVKSDVTDVKTRVGDVGSAVKDVKNDVTDVKTRVGDVGSAVKDVKSDVTDVKTQVGDVGSAVKDVKSDVTDVKTQVGDVGSDMKDVKSDVTDVKTRVEDVGSEVKELKANVVDIKKAMEAENVKGPLFPDSCIPDKIPHFVGRQGECAAVFKHLTKGDTRLVDVWGPPGFGKTSVAINVSHHLKEMEIPVYFTSLRGMKSKDELVSKLLSIFADAKQAFYVSSSDWLIQCLQQLKNPFVLVLDNADDLLESGDANLKENVLGFTEEILAQCSQIKLLLTTRESVDYLSHKLPIHQERVGVLDKVSSISLVKSLLLPDVSDDDCSCIVKECGQVPLAMRLMCSIIKEENVSLAELLEERKVSPLVEVLDNESFSDDTRLKTIINSSFERLAEHERNALVSLAVFPSGFGVNEARAVLDLKTVRLTKKVIGSLKRKSLIDCSDDIESFTIHSLLRSFIDERRIANQDIQAMFHAAQLRFYDYHITNFGVANEQFLTGHSNEAFQVFLGQRENILLSLVNGAKECTLYHKAVEVLSKAELFFYAVLPNEEVLFDRLYSTAVEEAQKRQRRDDECNLLAAKSFGSLGGFYVNRQSWDQSLQAGIHDTNTCPAKRLCYLGVHQLLCGHIDDGISSLRTSVDRLNSNCDENVLKVLAYHVLAVCYRKKGDKKNASQSETLCSNECKSTSFSPAVRDVFLRGSSSAGKLTDLASIVEQDVFFFVVIAELLPVLYRELEFGKQAETELSLMTHHLVGLHKVLIPLFHKGMLRVRILEACCNALYSLSCFKEAVEGFQMITDKLEKTLGNEHKRTAQNYLFRGLALKGLQKPDAAFCCLKKALDIRRKLLQKNLDARHGNNMVKETIDSLEHCLKMQENVDGTTFGQTNDFKVICEEIKSALKSLGKINGEDLAEIATNYNQLGYCYWLMDDTNGALELFQQALKIREEHVVDSVDKETCLRNIANAYFKMNRNTEAGKANQSALNLRKSLGIEDHAETAFIYHGLGMNHLKLGELSEALNAHHQGLKLRKKHLGDHTLTVHSFNLTGYAYFEMGDYEAAIEYFRNAAELAKTLLGDHEETASHFLNVTKVYLQIGNYREALDACQESKTIRLKLLGDHVDTATAFHCFGRICFKMSDFKGAVRSFRRASALRSNLLGDHLDTALSCHCLGEAQVTMNDFSGALESLHTALSIRKEETGFHSDTAATLELLGRAYEGLGQRDLASEQFKSALEMREYLQDDHVKTALSDPSNPFLSCYSEEEYLSMIYPKQRRV